MKMEWCRCAACRHKMFLYSDLPMMMANINIKCSSCKKIMDVNFSGKLVKVTEAINSGGAEEKS